jgi:hypothetical protein
MHESMILRETWKYECLGCLHEWQEEFEVRRSLDGHGGETVAYGRMGQPCISPWAELCCPSCGGYNVKTFPVGWTVPLARPHRTAPVRPRRTTPSGM